MIHYIHHGCQVFFDIMFNRILALALDEETADSRVPFLLGLMFLPIQKIPKFGSTVGSILSTRNLGIQ